jgi:hypothetical protein
VTNLVAITVKATDSSDYAAIKASAARAGADAASEFNRAFKLRADASAKGSESGGGLLGRDAGILSRLKSYANTPGGIGLLGTGGDTSLVSMLKNQIRQMGQAGGPGLLSGMSQSGGQSTTDMVREVLENNVTGNATTEDLVKQVLENSVTGNTSTTDMVREVLSNNVTGNVSTKDFIDQILEGNTPGNITTKDTVKVETDSSDLDKDAKADADQYGTSFAGELKRKLSGLLGSGSGGGSFIGNLLTGASGGGGDSGGGGGGALEAVSGALNSGGVAGGALPGMAGVSGMAATITGLAAAVAAVLPGLVSVGGALATIGGGFAILLATDKQFAAQMKSDLGSIEGVAASAAAGLAKPFESAATELVGYFKSIEPDLKEVFSATAPLIQPLVKGIENLLNAVGPGFLAMLKAGAPVMQQFAGGLGDLGHDLGSMFSDFAGAGASAGVATRAILDLLGELLPLLGKLGEIMASGLASAFAAFTGALGTAFKAIGPLLSIVAQFGGAVLTDLASVLTAIGSLLIDLAPSFTILTKVAGTLFNTLENAGVFAAVGDALENLAGPIANVVNALVKGLAPALPGIITLIGQLSGIITDLVSAGLAVMLTALAKVINFLGPVLPLIVDVVAAIKLWTIAQGLLNVMLDANPIGLVVLAVAALVGAIVELVNHWTTVWGTIKSVAEDAWNFIYNGWGKYLLPLLGPAGLLVLGLIEVYQHWQTIWGDIKAIFDDFAAAVLSLAQTAVQGFGLIVNAFLDLVSVIINGAAKAFGWVPGVGSLLRGAASSFDDFKTSVSNDFGDASSAIQGLIDKLEGIPAHVSTDINVSGTGSGGVVITASGLSASGAGNVKFTDMAAGGLLTGGVPGKDSIPLLAMPGEAVIPAWLVPSLAPYLKKMGIPGFAAGGLVGLSAGIPGIDSAAGSGSDGFASTMAQYAVNEMIAYVKAQLAAQAAAAASSAGGPGGGDPSANAALAKKLFPQWAGGIDWTDWNNVAMRESGWNQFADNPSSGAYGIPQALPYTKMPKAAWPASAGGSSNPTAQIDWMASYMSGQYGGPVGAWAHEEAYGWYDQGGWLPPGRSIAVNNTGAPERVIGPGGISVQLEVASGGQGVFEQFMSTWIKNYVRVKGGGDVQTAFGRT